MSLLGLELNDVGIMVAGADPIRLLQTDGEDSESPGYALLEKNRLLVGREAEGKAHLHPRQFSNSFWDQLKAEFLSQFRPHAQNNAEIAYAHLGKVWESVKAYGDEVLIAVPGFYTSDQLGLILGITKELSIPVKGFVSLAVAASSEPSPNRLLLHLDIHLHRTVITFLEQGDRLTEQDSITALSRGLDYLYGEWVRSIAEEFVRTTRFDPLHQAASEQELFNQLPLVLTEVAQNSSFFFELSTGRKTRNLTLTQNLFTQKSEVVFQEVRRSIAEIRKRHGEPDTPLTLQLTHRFTRLPGWQQMMSGIPDVRLVTLEPGAGALGAVRLWDQLSSQPKGRGVSFFTSRPWQPTQPPPLASSPSPSASQQISHPTHVLYRSLAYPITERPLTIGREDALHGADVKIHSDAHDVAPKHCSIQRRGDKVVLVDHSTHGTSIDGVPVAGSATLEVGQSILLGNSGEKLHPIACVERDEA
jgi:hypothetical protein